MTIRSDLGHDLDLEFSRSNAKLAISAKNGLIATKRKANTSIELKASNVTIRFNLGHDLDLFWIFKVKYEICYISTKSGPIATKQKANISIWTLGLKCDNGFDLGHDIDIWIFKVICDLDHLVTKVRCNDLPDSDRGDFRCRRAVDSSSSWGFSHLQKNTNSFVNNLRWRNTWLNIWLSSFWGSCSWYILPCVFSFDL